jgi:hypothetical protein
MNTGILIIALRAAVRHNHGHLAERDACDVPLPHGESVSYRIDRTPLLASLSRQEFAMSRLCLAACWLALCSAPPTTFAADPAWKPALGPLMTRWAKDVSPEKVHPEYPRPQMVRKNWTNLNGLWDYAVRPSNAPLSPRGRGAGGEGSPG